MNHRVTVEDIGPKYTHYHKMVEYTPEQLKELPTKGKAELWRPGGVHAPNPAVPEKFLYRYTKRGELDASKYFTDGNMLYKYVPKGYHMVGYFKKGDFSFLGLPRLEEVSVDTGERRHSYTCLAKVRVEDD